MRKSGLIGITPRTARVVPVAIGGKITMAQWENVGRQLRSVESSEWH